MGLPLLEPPVESDVRQKSTDQSAGSAHSRSPIRRQRPANRADRRRPIRPSHGESSGQSTRHFLPRPWVQDHSPASLQPVMQSYIRSTSNRDLANFQQLRYTVNSRSHTHAAQSSSSSSTPSAVNGSRADPSLPRLDIEAHPRIPEPLTARFDRSPDQIPSHARPRVAYVTRHPDLLAFFPGTIPARNNNHNSRSNRVNNSHLDGLGDRDRSLSPATDDPTWDLLLSTVTHAASHPSHGSSFASTAPSAAPSHASAASSRTSPGPDTDRAIITPPERGSDENGGARPRSAHRPNGSRQRRPANPTDRHNSSGTTTTTVSSQVPGNHAGALSHLQFYDDADADDDAHADMINGPRYLPVPTPPARGNRWSAPPLPEDEEDDDQESEFTDDDILVDRRETEPHATDGQRRYAPPDSALWQAIRHLLIGLLARANLSDPDWAHFGLRRINNHPRLEPGSGSLEDRRALARIMMGLQARPGFPVSWWEGLGFAPIGGPDR